MLARCLCLKVTFIQETFPPTIIRNHGSVENGEPNGSVDFSVSRGSFSTSMMSREEGRVKTLGITPRPHVGGRAKAALFALLSPKVL